MATIVSPVPEPAVRERGPGEVDVSYILQEIKDAINGGIELSNLSGALQSLVSPLWVPYGVSLPAAPYDGQKIDVQLHPTDGSVGRFRFNASSSSPYKWEATGSTQLAVAGGVGVHVPSPGTMVSVGGLFTAGWAGEYDIDVSASKAYAVGHFGGASQLEIGVWSGAPGATTFLGAGFCGASRSDRATYGPEDHNGSIGGTAVRIPIGKGTTVYAGGWAHGQSTWWEVTRTMMTIVPRRIA